VKKLGMQFWAQLYTHKPIQWTDCSTWGTKLVGKNSYSTAS